MITGTVEVIGWVHDNRQPMDSDNRQFLLQLNRRFYKRHADSFSRSREHPWSGWKRVAEILEDRSENAREALRVLDLGCGNGRFGRFLCQIDVDPTVSKPAFYLGVDSSLSLLHQAARRLEGNGFGWMQAELEGSRRDLLMIRPEAVSCVVAFGLMHHIPGHTQRRMLLERSLEILRPGGTLAVSFWQFTQLERHHRRMLDWDRVALPGSHTSGGSGLEEGDHLLRWGAEEGGACVVDRCRYCHHTSDDEASAIVRSLDVELIERFRADGADQLSNLYFVLRKPMR